VWFPHPLAEFPIRQPLTPRGLCRICPLRNPPPPEWWGVLKVFFFRPPRPPKKNGAPGGFPMMPRTNFLHPLQKTIRVVSSGWGWIPLVVVFFRVVKDFKPWIFPTRPPQATLPQAPMGPSPVVKKIGPGPVGRHTNHPSAKPPPRRVGPPLTSPTILFFYPPYLYSPYLFLNGYWLIVITPLTHMKMPKRWGPGTSRPPK